MKNSFIIYTENRAQVELLTTEQRADLLMALFDYAEKGETDELDPITEMAFSIFKSRLDRDAAKYEEVCEKRRAAASAGGKAKAAKRQQEVANGNKSKQVLHDNDNDNDPDNTNDIKKHRGKFVPPSVEEVAEYCREKNYNLDAEQFVAHYGSQDWKKSNGQKVSDWRKCVTTWIKRDKPQRAAPRPTNFTQRTNNYDEMNRNLLRIHRANTGGAK